MKKCQMMKITKLPGNHLTLLSDVGLLLRYKLAIHLTSHMTSENCHKRSVSMYMTDIQGI